MKRYYLWAVALLFLITACGKSEKEKAIDRRQHNLRQQQAYREAFKVAVLPTLDCLPIYLLKDSLLYDTTKVDVRLLAFTSQMDCDTAMAGGSVQASVTDLIRGERLKRRRHVPLIYLTETNAVWQLMANKQSEVKKPSDLADKYVAMTRFSITDYLTARVIKLGKPKYAVYKVQINNVITRQKMLENNLLDAAWLTEPQSTQARLRGDRVLYDSSDEAFVPGVIALVGESDIAKQEAFQQAYDKAVELINKKGVKYYGALIEKYMKVNAKVVDALPKTTFKRIVSPRPADILKAQRP